MSLLMNQTILDLNASANQSKFIQERITNVEKHLGEICQQVASYARKNAKIRDQGDELARAILNFAESEMLNKTSRYALTHFSNNLAAIQDYKQAEVQRLEAKVVQELGLYGNTCKQAKDDLRAGFSARRKELLQKKRLDRVRDRNPSNLHQISQAESDLQRASNDASRHMEVLQEQMDAFERKKLQDIKRVLLEFVKIEMAFHSKAIELFTKSYGNIQSINEEEDLEEFRNCLRLPHGASRIDTVLNNSDAHEISTVMKSTKEMFGHSTKSDVSLSPKKQSISNKDKDLIRNLEIEDEDESETIDESFQQ